MFLYIFSFFYWCMIRILFHLYFVAVLICCMLWKSKWSQVREWNHQSSNSRKLKWLWVIFLFFLVFCLKKMWSKSIKCGIKKGMSEILSIVCWFFLESVEKFNQEFYFFFSFFISQLNYLWWVVEEKLGGEITFTKKK